ncbi:hypothetical protein J7I94_19390 [Streptomyces sp. ISL-12]|uniref:hypothetical protein n=1 Tax=Streptomyces sp. ISL-12 TaxID=2819177 RepID=UPI001BEA84E9|nr:hypothetical protein [Streptomyces sp. ISL-12]MBT2412698.1 hypothetical protein [Streptomyces sp. ISL-12]
MTDIDFENAARCVARYEALRKAVRARKYTDRPGADWSLSSCAELPEYYYGRNKVMISSTEDGNAFEVLVFNRGRQVHSKAYKTIDAAFRNGEKFADVEYPAPAPKVEEPTAEETVENASVVEESSTVTAAVESLDEDVTTPATYFDPELSYFADGTSVVMR